MADKDQKKDQKKKRPTAEKRDIRNAKRRDINRQFKGSVRTAIRGLESCLSTKDAQQISEKLNIVYSLMDKGVKRGIFKLNKASRTKARYCAKVAAVAAQTD